MSERTQKERIEITKLNQVAGGKAVSTQVESTCCKPEGCFKPLEIKQAEWVREGCPKKCEYCWNLKYNNGYYCDV